MTEQMEQMIFDEGRRRGREEATKELMEWHNRVCEEMAKRHTADRPMLDDGTLVVTIADATAVTRVLVRDEKKNGDLYYADRPKGEWIYIDEPIIGNPYGRYRCSKCDLEEPFKSDYCPNCGADMRGEDNDYLSLMPMTSAHMGSRKEQTMSRYIDADTLKKDVARLHVLNDEAEIRRAYEYNPHVTSTDFEETLVSVFDAIDDAPTIEPKRGEWKPFDLTWGRSIWYCTACEESTEVPCDIWEHKPIYKYCPNCGADMRGDDNE